MTNSPEPQPDILCIVNNLNIGGSERMLIRRIKGFREKGFQIGVVALKTEGDLANELKATGIRVESLGIRSKYEIWKFPRLYKAIKKLKPRSVQLIGYFATTIGGMVARLAKVPIVIGYCGTVYRYLPSYRLLIQKFASFFMDVYVGNSKSVLNHMKNDIKVSEKKLRLIENGVDINFISTVSGKEYLERRFGISKDCKIVGTVGIFKKAKGYSYLISAAENVLKEGRDNVKFLLVGDGPLRQELEDLAVRLNIAENFVFTGLQRDVKRIIAGFDIFAFSSLWEGMPGAVQEAMALKKPIVGTQVSGMRDLIFDGHNGRLVPPKDPEALSAALLELLHNPEFAGSLGESAFQSVSEKYGADEMVQKWIALYRELAAKT